jgi:class 3 adenylate cyclase
LIRYDGRGNGLSQRDQADYSLEGHVRDLEAVIDAVGSEPVAILGVFHSGPAAIAYAARHPERVSHLLLWCTYAAGRDYWQAAQAEGLRVLRQTDYLMFLQAAAHELFGWAEDDEATRFAEIMSHAVSREDADRLIAATHDFDVETALREIDVPALVIHRRELRWLDISLSRNLASRIPGARLVVVEGPSPYPAAGDIEPPARALDDFLGREAPSARSGSSHRTLRTVLFTDLVGHTEIMSRLGDELGRQYLREHERLTRASLREHGGSEVKTLGDGFLASFDGVTDAVECAAALQRRFEAWNETDLAAELSTMTVRVGLNAGEPVEEDGDLFGATVILASRIADQAGGGEILASNTVRELSLGKRFTFEDRGEFVPKGFQHGVRLWAVDWLV